MTRQRRWQIKQKEKGNCSSCAKPAQGRSLCDKCAKLIGHVKYRKPLKSKWASVNWDQPDYVIAYHLKVTTNSVVYQRRKHTMKGTTHVHPSKNQAD